MAASAYAPSLNVEAKTTNKSEIKSAWGRELERDLSAEKLYDHDLDRLNITHDVLSDSIKMFVIHCNHAIDNERESELLDLISDAKLLNVSYLNLNKSEGFSLSPLEKICKSPRLLEQVSNILGVGSEYLQSISKPRKLTSSQRNELIKEFFINIKNFRPSVYSLEDVLKYARHYNIDLKNEKMSGMNAIQALCFSSHYTNEQRLRRYDLLSSYGIKLENIAEANQLIELFCNNFEKIKFIEICLMIIKQANFILEARLIQACLLEICKPAIGRTDSSWMEITKPSLLSAMRTMLNYVKECPDSNNDVLEPIISFCIKHGFPKAIFELLQKYPSLMKSTDADSLNKKIGEFDLPLMPGEHKDQAKSPAKKATAPVLLSHTMSSLTASMAKKSVDASDYKIIAEEKLTAVLGKRCCLMHLYCDIYFFEFSSEQSYETLQKDAALLNSKGIIVTVKPPSSLCGGIIKVPAKLQFDGLLSDIVTNLSAVSPEVPNSTLAPSN